MKGQNKKLACLIACACTAWSVTAWSETADYEKVRDAMLADLGNPERSFEFVTAAVAAGDTRGAIAALERLLLLNPGLANLELELGMLYLRAGSPQVARQHLESALRAPDVPAPVRARAEALLAQAAFGTQRGAFFLDFAAGARHESNANAGPESGDVLVLGFPAQLDETGRSQEDESLTTSLSLQHLYRLGGQRGHQLETSLSAFGSFYNENDTLNYYGAALEIGPRFALGDVLEPRWFIRPFASGSQQFLDGDKYVASAGGGLGLQFFASPRVLLGLSGGRQNQNFFNTPTRRVDDRDGDLTTVSLDFTTILSTRLRLSGFASELQNDAESASESYDRQRYQLALTAQLATAPRTGRAWLLEVSGAQTDSDYDEPDFLIDPFTAREDERREYGVSLFAPIGARSTVVLSYDYTDNESNLPNYSFDNQSVRLEWRQRF